MASAIAPPAFGPISGSAFTSSTSPEDLERILDSLDVESLEKENDRLQRAIQQLVQSNKEIQEFIQLEQEELSAHHQKQRDLGLTQEEHNSVEPDPEFVLAIEENKVVIAKYETTCQHLKKAIQKKRGPSSVHYDEHEGSSSSTTQQQQQQQTEPQRPHQDPSEAEGGVFL